MWFPFLEKKDFIALYAISFRLVLNRNLQYSQKANIKKVYSKYCRTLKVIGIVKCLKFYCHILSQIHSRITCLWCVTLASENAFGNPSEKNAVDTVVESFHTCTDVQN